MKKKRSIGYVVAWISIVLNLILFVIKYYAGTESGSIAVVADAWHSLSDTVTSFVVIIGFWIAARPPDKEHPYGHGRAESIASVIIATLLAVVGIELLIDSISRLQDKTAVEYDYIVIIVLAISIVSKEVMAQVSIRTGRKMNSESLVADGWHHRSDSISSVVILIGALFNLFWWFDGALGIIVSIMILYTTYGIMKNSFGSFLGEAPDPELLKRIDRIINETDSRITHIHHYRLHSYGDHRELLLDFRLPPEMSVKEAHDIAEIAERRVFERLNIRMTVHVEPVKEVK